MTDGAVEQSGWCVLADALADALASDVPELPEPKQYRRRRG